MLNNSEKNVRPSRLNAAVYTSNRNNAEDRRYTPKSQHSHSVAAKEDTMAASIYLQYIGAG